MEAEKSFYYCGFTSISLSDIMDLRHQSSAMCNIMLGGEDTPVVCNEGREPHTSRYPSRPVTKRNNQLTTHTSHYPSRPVEMF